jgi:hypothetical protein
MKVRTTELYHAIGFWQVVANENGWGDKYDTADLTIWVDGEGHVTDSVATQTGGGCVYIEEEASRHDDQTS